MYIEIANKRIQKLINDEAALQRKYGKDCAEAIYQRLAQIEASDNIGHLLKLGIGNVEQLKGNLSGKYSIRTGKKTRIVFVPVITDDMKEDDEYKATKVRVLSLEGYHD